MSDHTRTQARTLPDRVDPLTLADLRAGDQPPVLLDVRTPAEFESEHIDGAVNIPLDTLQQDPARVAAELPAPAVLVCRSGARAGQAHEALEGAGATAVRPLEGGMLAWNQTAQEVVRGRQRWDIERQVRFTAGLLVLIGAVTSLVWPPALALSIFVGAGLVVAAATNTCAMGMLLARMPWNGTAERCDLDVLLGRLR